MMPTLGELYIASDSDPAPVVAFLRELAESYALAQPLRVLDVGCGPGRLFGPLERLRWEVTGMEPNAEFLATAREAAAGSRRVRVLRGGFLEVEESGGFDLVVGINSSFAHLLTPAERGEALARCRGALRPGGVVFLDLPNFLWILRNYRAPEPFVFTAQGETVTLERRHEIDFHNAVFHTTDDYVFAATGRSEMRLVHSYGITTFAELRQQLADAGFEEPRTFNGYGARAERLSGPRMLVAARKPHAE